MLVRDALTTRDLFLCVADFQDGSFKDLMPFRHVKKPPHSAYMHKLPTALTHLHQLLVPWLATYGTARLDKLFGYMPHMRDLIILHSVVFGDVPTLTYLLERFLKEIHGFSDPLLDVAAAYGQLAVLQILHAVEYPGCTRNAIDWAAFHGHLPVILFLHAHRKEGATTKAMDAAAMNGHREVVKFLHMHRTEGCTTDAMTEAAWNGHLDVVIFLHTHRSEGCSIWTMDRAAWSGRLAVVRFLHEVRSEKCTAQAMDMAAWNGHLDVLEYLHGIGAPCTANALQYAAMNGHLEIIKFLVSCRREGNFSMAIAAAEQRSQSAVVQYLKAHAK
ncbi:unnamed protein product [Aphanomyces euteiches]|uniref:Uncharacterized protein n=1 Tax=Aphanomyces euteiches TaxID=100861 RepID=A0A6G0XBZ8_9STRA|nr:hypothetical protein Ae201684_006645 [Aphanomyces euteiches]KAH9090843.1 hypothetical protein Ae201684P_006247 [Aphanomyces euteiches]KAH9148778.1 hypothetical protein AeRB84_007963 [Aphanomyces euteiches]